MLPAIEALCSYEIFPSVRYVSHQITKHVLCARGDANAMADRVMLHLLGYNCNPYTGIGDKLKTLNVHEIWNGLCLMEALTYLMIHALVFSNAFGWS